MLHLLSLGDFDGFKISVALLFFSDQSMKYGHDYASFLNNITLLNTSPSLKDYFLLTVFLMDLVDSHKMCFFAFTQ